GVASSALAHLTVFVMALAAVMVLRTAALAPGPSPRREYALLVGGSVIAVALIVLREIFVPIAFRGVAAWGVATLAGLVVALTWSSVARYRHADAPSPGSTPMDVWLAPITSSRSRIVTALGLLLVPFLAYVVTQRVAGFDWNFMVQKLI